METPESLLTFDIDDNFINQWFDSFHPSIKTYATNFVINKLKRYDFNLDLIEDKDEKIFADMLFRHFTCFLKLKAMDENPGRAITGIYLPVG